MSVLPQVASTQRKIVVVDDFLQNPDEIREFALKQKYAHRGSAGVRTEPFPFECYRIHFADLLGIKLPPANFSCISYPHCNGCFQWCSAETLKIIHCDDQQWAGVLHLTPDAPLEAGTVLYRSRNPSGRYWFRGGNYDETKWEVVDRIGNVYNRLVLWNGKAVHSASTYFGQVIEDSRLFQVFFFNAE